MLGFNIEDAIALQSQLVKCIENIEDDWTSVKTQWDQLKDCWYDRQYDRFEPFFQALSENYIKTLDEYKKYSEFVGHKIREAKEMPELDSKQESLINSSIQNTANLNAAIGLSSNAPSAKLDARQAKFINDKIQNAANLSQNAANLSAIGLSLNDPVLLAVGIPSLLNSLKNLKNSKNLRKNPGGGHGYQYQRERKKFLMSLANDPKQPKHIKGWIKQEERKIWNNKKFKKAPDGIKQRAEENAKKNTGIKGKEHRTKVNSSQYMRSHPNRAVGHGIAGIDESSNFRLELPSMNSLRPHIARARGLPPSYF